MNEEKTTSEKNYEKIIFLLAVYFADRLNLDISKIKEYSDLTAGQKTYAKKILEKNPKITNLLKKNSDVVLDERNATNLVAKITQNESGKSDLVKVTTYGDSKVCDACAKWQNKILSLSGQNKNYSSLDDFIRSNGLHPNCRCSLQEISTDEIPLNKINPRYETRKQARPDIYNNVADLDDLLFC